MTMMRCGSAGASILLAAAVVTFALPLAAQQGERRIESDKYIARIIESTPSSNTSYGDHILLVIDKAEKLAFRLEALGSGTFDSMNLYQDRLVFFGKHGTNAQGAMVFDLRRREVIDSFLCWYKTVSPSGRWITYNWHYPRFAHNLYSDILLFYDLERPPAENRVEGSESRGDQYFIGRNVGVPVYPPENASPRNYTPWVGENPEAKHDLRLHEPSFHAWVEREGRLLLIDETPTGKKFVVIDFQDDARRSTILEGHLPAGLLPASLLNGSELRLDLRQQVGIVSYRPCAECPAQTIDVPLSSAP
jgi:hypothetical protein